MAKFIVNYRNFSPIAEGLRSCGCTVLENLWNPTEDQLHDCLGYLVCMYDAIKRPLETLKLKKKLNRHDVPLIAWNRDGPWHKGEKPWRLWMLKNLPFLDIYATHTLQDSAGFAPVTLYLPNAAWANVYNLAGVTLEELREPGRYQCDVSFYGRLDPIKYPEMHKRHRFLTELSKRLAQLGICAHFLHSENMPQKDQIELVQRSRINLNYGAGCDDGPEISWGLPERCYGIQACGGFLISDYRRHAEDDFVQGEEWVSFESMDDCVEKIRYYLQHFDEARQIAERAHHRVMRDHTYVQRAKALINAANKWSQTKAAATLK